MSLPKEYSKNPNTLETQRLSLQVESEKKFFDHVLDLIKLRPGQRVFDFGSGEGSLTRIIANRVGQKGSVIGIEIEPKRVIISRQQAVQLGVTNVKYIKSDITQPLNFTRLADVAFSNYVIGNLEKKDALTMVNNMKNAIKDNGTIAIHTTGGWTLKGMPEVLYEQSCQVREEISSSKGEDLAMDTKLTNILEQADIHNIQIFELKHNEFYGKAPDHIIKNKQLLFLSPEYQKIMIQALGSKQEADLYVNNFLQWMGSYNSNTHIYLQTVLAVGKK